jgi:pilus assembly protein Flp/PilA
MKFLQKARRFLADERGSNAIEYGLIASLIAVAIIAAVDAVGDELITLFTAITTAL